MMTQFITKNSGKRNEYFKFPQSVKFNKLETLNIFGGRDVKLDSLLKQTDSSNLKQLILDRMYLVKIELYQNCQTLKFWLSKTNIMKKQNHFPNYQIYQN